MDSLDILYYIEKYSVASILMAVAVYFTSKILTEKLSRMPLKLKGLLPFILAMAINSIYQLVIGKRFSLEMLLEGAIVIGGLSILISSFFSKIIKNIENDLEEKDPIEIMLQAYISLDEIKSVITTIKTDEQIKQDRAKLKALIDGHTSENLDDELLEDLVQKIIDNSNKH